MNAQTPAAQGAAPEFSFTDADYRAIAGIAKARFGLDLQDSKKPLVYSRLAKRLRALRIDSFSDYCKRLNAQDDTIEESYLLSALTTNVTQFFREPHHFAYIKDRLGPDIVARAQAGKPIRFWSAACSSGEEAYCLAATLLGLFPQVDRFNVRILATDIDPTVIAKAEAASYPVDQLAQIPQPLRDVMVMQGNGSGRFTITPKVRQMVRFGQLNLMADWPMRNPFDLVMCRNAAIYFDKDTQARLWRRFADCLHTDGHLMIGHSERLTGPATNLFESVAVTTYRKTAATG